MLQRVFPLTVQGLEHACVSKGDLEMPISEMTRTGTDHSDCCNEATCDSCERNNYFNGKRLSPHSFQLEQKYGLDRRRLLNRAIHGWGVVYGYKITSKPLDDRVQSGKLSVGPGLALDICGRELLQVADRTISLDDVILLDDKGRVLSGDDKNGRDERAAYLKGQNEPAQSNPACWLLSVHYAEQYNGPVDVKSSCHCEHREWDHICETVRYSLKRVDCKECVEKACGEHRDTAGQDEETDNIDYLAKKREGCGWLCEYVTNLKPKDDCGCLREISEVCGKVGVDIGHGVRLACVQLVWDNACKQWMFGEEIEACVPRRLVKRNDLLFALIPGCNLTRIRKISWASLHRREKAVEFKEFDDMFGDLGQGKDKYVTKFTVEFSRPVQKITLRSDCFAFTVMSSEREGGWRETLRVPIVEINTEGYKSDNSDNPETATVTGGTIVVDGSWVEDALRGRKNRFQGSEAWVEIEVRGDYILDCNGQTVDANAVGISPYPSGNGTPGGTFLSCFRLDKA